MCGGVCVCRAEVSIRYLSQYPPPPLEILLYDVRRHEMRLPKQAEERFTEESLASTY